MIVTTCAAFATTKHAPARVNFVLRSSHPFAKLTMARQEYLATPASVGKAKAQAHTISQARFSPSASQISSLPCDS